MNRFLLSLTFLLVASLANVVQADEAEEYQKIRKLMQEGKISAAEEAFDAAIEEFPDSARLLGLHYGFYYYNNRDKNYDSAIEHLEAHIQQNLLPNERRPQGNLASLATYVNMLVGVYESAGTLKEAGDKLDQLTAELETAAQSDQENVYAQIAVREMQNRKLIFLAETGQQDQARTILTTRLSAAEKAAEADSDDMTRQLDLMYLLKGASQLAEETGSDDADQKQQKFLERLIAAAKAHPDSVPLVLAALNENYSAIGGMARKQPYLAETLLANLKEFVESIESEESLIKSRLASINRAIPSFARSIATGKLHADLIGKQAVALDAEAWVNGGPLADADLEGKVVLLDFWAVWCGPCIATFPHLREWKEKYEDKGLVIIGVTRYYNYDWDEEANRPKKVVVKADDENKDDDDAAPEFTPEDEQAAMVKFAEHHELTHRFMITPKESTFQKEYGVSGIPQAVLIDREGKIRLIRVGSGSANAEEIDTLLVELIGDGN